MRVGVVGVLGGVLGIMIMQRIGCEASSASSIQSSIRAAGLLLWLARARRLGRRCACRSLYVGGDVAVAAVDSSGGRQVALVVYR
jgi:hypothetical protein